MTGGKHALIVAADTPPVVDLDCSVDQVEAALASLLPWLRRQGGGWYAATVDRGARDQVIAVPPARSGAGRLGASQLRSLYRQQPLGFVPGWFDAYLALNRRHADAIARVAAHSGTVWVHGRHLHLVPGLLRQMRPDLAIVLHLHDPFPPAELIARLPEHRDLLNGLLGADLIALPHRRCVDNLLDLADRVYGSPVRGDRIRQSHGWARAIHHPIPVDTTVTSITGRTAVTSAVGTGAPESVAATIAKTVDGLACLSTDTTASRGAVVDWARRALNLAQGARGIAVPPSVPVPRPNRAADDPQGLHALSGRTVEVG